MYLISTFTSGISLYTLYTTGITHYYQYQHHTVLITTIMKELGHNQMLNVFIDIQTSKEVMQMDTDKMMTYGTFKMDDEKLTQS